jgi:hypothetical protein
MSYLKFAADTFENEIVIPSSDQIRNHGNNSTVHTQQYFTPKAGTCDGSVRVDETPAAVSENEEVTESETKADAVPCPSPSKVMTPLINPSIHGDEATVRPKKARGSRVVQETDDEMDISPASNKSGKKRPLDEELEILEPKRRKSKEEASARKQGGRAKKSPLSESKPTKLADRQAPKRSMASNEVKTSSVKSASHSPVEKKSSPQRSKAKLRIVASKELGQRPSTKKFLQDRFVTVSEHVDSTTDILCIVNGELKTTVKILKALALGIPIVSDQWISDSVTARELLPWEGYIAKDLKNEKLFNVSSDWSAGGSSKREKLFDGNVVMITPELKTSYGAETFKQLREICQLMGAKELMSTTAAKSPRVNDEDKVIWLARDSKDKLVKQLKQLGTNVYSKDLLGVSIFRGELALEDEVFML